MGMLGDKRVTSRLPGCGGPQALQHPQLAARLGSVHHVPLLQLHGAHRVPKVQEPWLAVGGSPGTLVLCQREGPRSERRVREKTPSPLAAFHRGPDSGWMSEREDLAGGFRIPGART